MEQQQNIIITDTLSGIGTEAYKGYLGHALCLDGMCRITFNGKELEMKRGDLMIVRQGRLVQSVKADSSFRVTMIYIAAPFIEVCTPQCNYGMKGQLALFLNPIMHLTEEQFEQCRRNFENLQIRIAQTAHHFYHDMLINIVQSLIIDFFDFHASLYQEQDVSTQYATLMSRFLSLLENGELSHSPGSDLVCRQVVCNIKVSVRSIEVCQWLCRQLLDQPLHGARHLSSVARQVTHLCANLRHVRILITSLF